MVICGSCAVESVCTKTGRAVRWRGEYCKRGDEYTCPVCGAKFIYVMASTEGYSDDLLIGTEKYLEMNQCPVRGL